MMMVSDKYFFSAVRRVNEIPCHLDLNEGVWLSSIAEGRVVLEIGSYKGRSSCFIGLTARMLFCCEAFCGQKSIRNDQSVVDFREVRRAWYENVSNHKLRARIELIEMRSEDAFDIIREKCSGELGLLFIDGGHDLENVMNDLRYTKLLIPGGIVAVHDYSHPSYPDVAKAVDQWSKTNRHEFKELSAVGTMAAFVAMQKLYFSSSQPVIS